MRPTRAFTIILAAIAVAGTAGAAVTSEFADCPDAGLYYSVREEAEPAAGEACENSNVPPREAPSPAVPGAPPTPDAPSLPDLPAAPRLPGPPPVVLGGPQTPQVPTPPSVTAPDAKSIRPTLPDFRGFEAPDLTVPRAPALPSIGGAAPSGGSEQLPWASSGAGSVRPPGHVPSWISGGWGASAPPTGGGPPLVVATAVAPGGGQGAPAEGGISAGAFAAAGVALLSPFLLALYRRLVASRVLENPVRRAARDHVLAAPGVSCAEVARALDVHHVTAERHLRTLVEFGHLSVLKTAAGPRYFENHGRYRGDAQRALALLRRPGNADILRAVLRDPRAGVADLGRRLGLAKSTMSRRVAILRDAGLLEPAGRGFAVPPRALDALLAPVSTGRPHG